MSKGGADSVLVHIFSGNAVFLSDVIRYILHSVDIRGFDKVYFLVTFVGTTIIIT